MDRWDGYAGYDELYHADYYGMYDYYPEDELYHYGVKGQKWGVRRYQNADGSLTDAGRAHYGRSYGGRRAGGYSSGRGKKVNWKKVGRAAAIGAGAIGAGLGVAYLAKTGKLNKLNPVMAKAGEGIRSARRNVKAWGMNRAVDIKSAASKARTWGMNRAADISNKTGLYNLRGTNYGKKIGDAIKNTAGKPIGSLRSKYDSVRLNMSGSKLDNAVKSANRARKTLGRSARRVSDYVDLRVGNALSNTRLGTNIRGTKYGDAIYKVAANRRVRSAAKAGTAAAVGATAYSVNRRKRRSRYS